MSKILSALILSVTSVFAQGNWNSYQPLSQVGRNNSIARTSNNTLENCSGATACWKMNELTGTLSDSTASPITLTKNASGAPTYGVGGYSQYGTGITFAGGEVFASGSHPTKIEIGKTTDLSLFVAEGLFPTTPISQTNLYGSCTACSESFLLLGRITGAADNEYKLDLASEEIGYNQAHCAAHASTVFNPDKYAIMIANPHTVEVQLDRAANTCTWFMNGQLWGPTGYSAGWSTVVPLRINGVRNVAIGADDRGGAPPASPYTGNIYFVRQTNSVPTYTEWTAGAYTKALWLGKNAGASTWVDSVNGISLSAVGTPTLNVSGPGSYSAWKGVTCSGSNYFSKGTATSVLNLPSNSHAVVQAVWKPNTFTDHVFWSPFSDGDWSTTTQWASLRGISDVWTQAGWALRDDGAHSASGTWTRGTYGESQVATRMTYSRLVIDRDAQTIKYYENGQSYTAASIAAITSAITNSRLRVCSDGTTGTDITLYALKIDIGTDASVKSICDGGPGGCPTW